MKERGSVALVAGLIIAVIAIVGVLTLVLYVNLFSIPAKPPVEPPTTGEANLVLGIQNGNDMAYYEVWIDEEKAERGITLWPADFYEYNFTFEIEDCTTYNITIKVHIGGVHGSSYEDSTTVSLCDEDEIALTYWAITREFRQ